MAYRTGEVEGSESGEVLLKGVGDIYPIDFACEWVLLICRSSDLGRSLSDHQLWTAISRS